MTPKREEILNYLTTHLTPGRIAHCLGVEKTSLKIAQKFSIDPRKVSTAALLHDCAKGMSSKEQISFCREHQIPLKKSDFAAPGVIHTRTGAWIAEHTFNIDDSSILNAIKRHATGYPEMGLLEKIIFAADYLDPGRKFKQRKHLFHIIEKDFEQGILTIAIDKLQYVLGKPDYIHPDSLLFYNRQFHLVRGEQKQNP